MIIPSKYENLNKSLLVVGYEIARLLKEKSYNIENLFQQVKKKVDINPDAFYDALTFLWLSEIIERQEFQVYLKKK